MRPERYSYSYDISSRTSPWRRRMVFALLVLLSLALLALSRSNHPHLQEVRMEVNDFLAPVMHAFATPVRGVRNWLEDKNALLRAHEENKKLRAENETLRQWQGVAKALKAENESLRTLAGYRPAETTDYVAARVIGQSPDVYAGTLVIDVGKAQQIASLAPVIDSEGLVGRTIEVGERTARVLLLSDPASRIPVVTADSRHRAILAGTGDELLRLTFISGDIKEITLGETVMTTAQGALMPESIMVGTVFRREADGDVLVKPLRPLAASEYVRVMVEH